MKCSCSVHLKPLHMDLKPENSIKTYFLSYFYGSSPKSKSCISGEVGKGTIWRPQSESFGDQGAESLKKSSPSHLVKVASCRRWKSNVPWANCNTTTRTNTEIVKKFESQRNSSRFREVRVCRLKKARVEETQVVSRSSGC